jgi:hypothetical protein
MIHQYKLKIGSFAVDRNDSTTKLDEMYEYAVQILFEIVKVYNDMLP